MIFVLTGDKLSYLFRTNDNENILLKVNETINSIFDLPLISFSLKDITAGILFSFLIRLLLFIKMSDSKNYRKGEEYGSASFGGLKDIEPCFYDHRADTETLSKKIMISPDSVKDKEHKKVVDELNENMLKLIKKGNKGLKKEMFLLITFKVPAYEMAHSILHQKDSDDKKDRNTKEVEAESVAFTVCRHFGIDTGDYSFGYILGWSKNATLDEFKQSLATIQKCASELIGGIETNLSEIKLQKKSIKNRLSESKDKSSTQNIKTHKEKTNEFCHI